MGWPSGAVPFIANPLAAMQTQAQPTLNTPLQSPARQVAPGVYVKRLLFVNVIFLGEPGGPWILIDAGMPGYADAILAAAHTIYGPDARPEACVLTHGHYDHIGSLADVLARVWPGLPVYAHPLELPYLDGRAAYPPPDPTVGGGVMPWVALGFPRGPFDFSANLRRLPADGTVPYAPGWHYIHTPGHAPGHVSLWREPDRCLVAGDAVVCTRQESAYWVATQRPELNGPPKYWTTDWQAAARSVRTLAELKPTTLVSGHGAPLQGLRLFQAFGRLTSRFEAEQVPHGGRYATTPALQTDEGVVYVPHAPLRPYLKLGLWVAGGLAALWWLGKAKGSKRPKKQKASPA